LYNTLLQRFNNNIMSKIGLNSINFVSAILNHLLAVFQRFKVFGVDSERISNIHALLWYYNCCKNLCKSIALLDINKLQECERVSSLLGYSLEGQVGFN
jgi:hypothetical protein